jgi:predicted CXXCH cytochrome family protein
MQMRDRPYTAWGIGLALTAALPLFAGFTTLGWELSELLGLVGTIACLALCGCPVRPRQSDPPVLLSLGRHEMLGWMAVGAALLHVLVALASDHKVVEYLKPTSPLYQLSGIAALAVLLVLTLTSVAGVRRRTWRSHRDFQATHIILSCVLAVLLGAHVITTGRYTGGYGRRIVYVATAAGGIAILLRRRRTTGAATHEPLVTRRLAFGRHSTLMVGVIAVAMIVLGSLIPRRALVALREPLLPRAEMLPLNFDHRKHTSVNCLVCHHNYADGRGFDACIFCHRSARTDLKVGVEARFHDFCLNCHRNPGPQFSRHGPVSGCTACHSPAAS